LSGYSWAKRVCGGSAGRAPTCAASRSSGRTKRRVMAPPSEFVRGGERMALQAVERAVDDVAAVAEVAGDVGEDVGIVVDDEDTHGCAAGKCK
jgi:hypothetical protein